MVVEFEERIDAEVNAKVVAGRGDRKRSGSVASATSFHALLGRDSFRSAAHSFRPVARARLERAAANARPEATMARGTDPYSCVYGAFGPDLEEVARSAGMTEDEVITRHAAPVYRVFMLGFTGVCIHGNRRSEISRPRRSTRVRESLRARLASRRPDRIYPLKRPAEWQIIGRTGRRPFDPARAEPFLLKAGDAVRFYPDASPGERRVATVRSPWWKWRRAPRATGARGASATTENIGNI